MKRNYRGGKSRFLQEDSVKGSGLDRSLGRNHDKHGVVWPQATASPCTWSRIWVSSREAGHVGRTLWQEWGRAFGNKGTPCWRHLGSVQGAQLQNTVHDSQAQAFRLTQNALRWFQCRHRHLWLPGYTSNFSKAGKRKLPEAPYKNPPDHSLLWPNHVLLTNRPFSPLRECHSFVSGEPVHIKSHCDSIELPVTMATSFISAVLRVCIVSHCSGLGEYL